MVRGSTRGLCAAAVAVAVVLAAAGPARGSDYCVPENTQYDPVDVPEAGSTYLTRPGVTRTFIEVDGIRTPVISAGPPDSREAVVFVHGSPGSGQDWIDFVVRAGALGRRAVALDMPGFGHATKPWGATGDIREASAFLDQVLARLGIDRAHLVFHDLGGAAALQWGSEHPRRLLSAVVVASGLLGYEHHNFATVNRTPDLGEAFWTAMNRAAWRQGMTDGQQERPLPESFVDGLYDDLDRPSRCTILGVYRSAEADQINAWGKAQAAVLKRRPRRPALIVWGSHDPYLPPEMAARQREAFPAAAVHIFGESGHWPFVDDAARTMSLFAPFVRCQPTGRRDPIRVRVRPRRAVAGAAATVRLRAWVRREGRNRPVCGARATLAGEEAVTSSTGRARLVLPSLAAGAHRVRVRKPGLRRGRVTVRVRPGS